MNTTINPLNCYVVGLAVLLRIFYTCTRTHAFIRTPRPHSIAQHSIHCTSRSEVKAPERLCVAFTRVICA